MKLAIKSEKYGLTMCGNKKRKRINSKYQRKKNKEIIKKDLERI